ncbi:ferredoxin III, nif-specific [Thiorhodococcus mannitoliphagus]|uniref:Ferredoxin III n=1 Tax=Thiorhodococcus mannitoliphagus TaxID=329406 RepID=A0A6P1DPJ9_9GAMM|nr:ferredoxin III, nif-specific [Thiorhodococcus mannitoliphagus]NEX19839.1 ferredoxin III, nif-specific [Thiorhodococcus mannitoliphagus]
MSVITGLTRGGVEWTPAFIVDLDQTKCIGCGRCYKVCPRSVFELIDRDDLDLDDDNLDDDDFDEAPGMVMNLADTMDCIGCEACSRVCPKGCLSHKPEAMAA